MTTINETMVGVIVYVVAAAVPLILMIAAFLRHKRQSINSMQRQSMAIAGRVLAIAGLAATITGPFVITPRPEPFSRPHALLSLIIMVAWLGNLFSIPFILHAKVKGASLWISAAAISFFAFIVVIVMAGISD